MFSTLAYKSYKACIYSSQTLFSTVSTYYNHLGFVRSAEGLAIGANQAAAFLEKKNCLLDIARGCRIIGAPEELITTSKNLLTWFELTTRIALLPKLGEMSWQRGTALFCQIGQKGLETFVLLPMKWKFLKTSPHIKEIKFGKEILSGIASLFGAWGAEKEIHSCDARLAKWRSPQRVSRVERRLEVLRQKIRLVENNNNHRLGMIAEARLAQEKCWEKAQGASSVAQKVYLLVIAAFHQVKAEALIFRYARSDNAVMADRTALLTKHRREEALLIENVAIRKKILNPTVNGDIRARMASYLNNKVHIKIHNLGVLRSRATCARDFNLAKLLLLPGIIADYAGVKNVWLDGFNFVAGVAVTYFGFRRTFNYINHAPRQTQPLFLADLV